MPLVYCSPVTDFADTIKTRNTDPFFQVVDLVTLVDRIVSGGPRTHVPRGYTLVRIAELWQVTTFSHFCSPVLVMPVTITQANMIPADFELNI